MCFHCSQKAHETTIVQLQSEFEVALLRAEVAELWAALDKACAIPVSATTQCHTTSGSQTQASLSWATATRNMNKPTCNDSNSVTGSCGTSSTSKKNVNQPGANSTGEPNYFAYTSKVKVAGARRI